MCGNSQDHLSCGFINHRWAGHTSIRTNWSILDVCFIVAGVWTNFVTCDDDDWDARERRLVTVKPTCVCAAFLVVYRVAKYELIPSQWQNNIYISERLCGHTLSNMDNPPPSAPWPVRKGIFRSTGQSDFIPQRSPSPIVEMPATPVQQTQSNPLSPLSPRCISVLEAGCMSPPPPSSQSSQSPSPNHFGSNRASPVKSPSPPGTTNMGPPKSKLKSRMLTPINVSIREIPIEVQQEV